MRVLVVDAASPDNRIEDPKTGQAWPLTRRAEVFAEDAIVSCSLRNAACTEATSLTPSSVMHRRAMLSVTCLLISSPPTARFSRVNKIGRCGMHLFSG